VSSTKSIAFGVAACVLLVGSIVFGRQQDRDLSGIHGIPVEGHDIVAGIEIVGTKQLDLSRSGWEKLQKRLRENGANLRLGWPLETPTLCRFKEVVRDVMSEKGFLDVEVTHDMRPTYGDWRNVTLVFTIVEGKRSRRTTPTGPLVSPAERCSMR
jgi:outer membrane protein assembly factor BamA